MHLTLSVTPCFIISLLVLRLFGDYVNEFHSYLINQTFQVRVSGILSLPFEILSGTPQ
jgi:hypothetical protein